MKIFYEVDIQNDFMNKGGRLYVPEAEMIKPQVEKLADYALQNEVKRVRSMDRHFIDDPELLRNKGPFPEHCMDYRYAQKAINGDLGVELIPEVKPGFQIYLENKTLEGDNFRKYYIPELELVANSNKEIVIEKQHYDVFTNPAVEKLLQLMQVNQAVVYGVATDYCVRAAVLGMQKRNIQCYVVEDAIKGVFPDSTKTALEEMVNAGAKLVTTKQVLEGKI